MNLALHTDPDSVFGQYVLILQPSHQRIYIEDRMGDSNGFRCDFRSHLRSQLPLRPSNHPVHELKALLFVGRPFARRQSIFGGNGVYRSEPPLLSNGDHTPVNYGARVFLLPIGAHLYVAHGDLIFVLDNDRAGIPGESNSIANLAKKKLEVKRMRQWKLAEAKNRFSEVVNRALAEGPQGSLA